MMQLEFSRNQQKIVTTGITMLSMIAILLTLMWFLRGVAGFLTTFSGVFVPLASGALLALIIRPYYLWLLKLCRQKAVLAILSVFLTILLPLLASLIFFGGLLFQQLGDLLAALPELGAKAGAWAQERWPDIQPMLEEQQASIWPLLKKLMASVWSAGGSVFAAISGLLGWFILPIYLAFFLMVPPLKVQHADKWLPFLKEKTRGDVMYLCEQFVEIMVSFFRGQMVIALMQGVLYAIGFSLIGLKFGFVLGLTLGFLNIVPYLGAIIGFSICLPLALFQTGGGWVLLVLVLVVISVVQLIESYVLTPKIMGDRTGLHPLVIIVAILFWGTALSGVMGMLLAIPLTAFFVVFWRLAKERYIREWI